MCVIIPSAADGTVSHLTLIEEHASHTPTGTREGLAETPHRAAAEFLSPNFTRIDSACVAQALMQFWWGSDSVWLLNDLDWRESYRM